MGRLRTMMDDALQRLGVAGEDGFVIAALYKFVDLPDSVSYTHLTLPTIE